LFTAGSINWYPEYHPVEWIRVGHISPEAPQADNYSTVKLTARKTLRPGKISLIEYMDFITLDMNLPFSAYYFLRISSTLMFQQVMKNQVMDMTEISIWLMT
jgi:hypothetical protein